MNKIVALEEIMLKEKPRNNSRELPLNKYRSVLAILHCKGYSMYNMHKKLLEAGLDFTVSQVVYYLKNHPLEQYEIANAERKISISEKKGQSK